jgi:hypothetical protein
MVEFDLGRFYAFVEDYKATKALVVDLYDKLANASDSEIVKELKGALEAAQKALVDEEVDDEQYEAAIATLEQNLVAADAAIVAKDAAIAEAVALKDKYAGELAVIVEELDKVFPAPAPVVEPTPEVPVVEPPVVEAPVETPVVEAPVVEEPAPVVEPTPEAPVEEPPAEPVV